MTAPRAGPKKRGAAATTAPADADPRVLQVRVLWGDLTEAPGDVLLVGHYAGVLPMRAEAALDAWVSGASGNDLRRRLITDVAQRGVLRGDLGELLFFPGPGGRLGAVAGMGPPGTFTAPQAKRMARTVAQTVGLLPWHGTLTTVVIGSGEGNMRIEDAAREFLTALVEALEADPLLTLRELVFVEKQLDRALQLLQELHEVVPKLRPRANGQRPAVVAQLLGECEGRDVSDDFGCSMLLAGLCGKDEAALALRSQALQTLPAELRDRVQQWLEGRAAENTTPAALRQAALRLRLRSESERARASDPVPVRISCTHDATNLRMTAITARTTVTERVLTRKLPLAQRAGERARHAAPAQRDDAAKRLRRHVMPADFNDILDSLGPMVLELDAETAALPWEMLPAGDNAGPMALARPLARQLRTRYSPRPFELMRAGGWRALVIGDPAGGQQALASAQTEAVAVAELLSARGLQCTLLVGPPDPGSRAGPLPGVAAADYAEVIDNLLEGNYDIVHYCGHAMHDGPGGASGWVFEGQQLLTGTDLEGAERPPRLVFANACVSAQLQQAPRAGLLEGLVDAFFQQGVRHYIGTAWAVPSEPAKVLALAFYTALFGDERCSIGEALLAARQAVRTDTIAATWAAYQHYGDPIDRFDRPPGRQPLARRPGNDHPPTIRTRSQPK